jgi:hypothetical protein
MTYKLLLEMTSRGLFEERSCKDRDFNWEDCLTAKDRDLLTSQLLSFPNPAISTGDSKSA